MAKKDKSKLRQAVAHTEDLTFCIKKRGNKTCHFYYEVSINIPGVSVGILQSGQWQDGGSTASDKANVLDQERARGQAVEGLYDFLCAASYLVTSVRQRKKPRVLNLDFIKTVIFILRGSGENPVKAKDILAWPAPDQK